MDRITAINKSLRVFTCGLLGFLPVIGLLPGLYALAVWVGVRRGFRGEWNPASRYLNWGAFFAAFGLASSVIIALAWIVTMAS
jgi:hypothetical protein